MDSPGLFSLETLILVTGKRSIRRVEKRIRLAETALDEARRIIPRRTAVND
jgi:hypothetical protein